MAVTVEKYGAFPFGEEFENNFFHLSFIKSQSSYIYRRELFNGESTSFFVSSGEIEQIIIQPSEPLTNDYPKTLLMLEFEKPVKILPESDIKLWSEIPISTAVLIQTKKSTEVVDLFNVSKVKFALYGDAHTGSICRYWKSECMLDPFVPKGFQTAQLELDIFNSSSSTVNVSKLVFDFTHIRIFYDDILARAKAYARVQSPSLCETEFVVPNDVDGFRQTIDLIPSKLLTSSKFVMLYGL